MKVLISASEAYQVKAYLATADGAFPFGAPACADSLENARRYEAFDGKAGQVCCLRDYQTGEALLLAGLGDRTDAESVRRAVAKLVECAESRRIDAFGLHLRLADAKIVRAAAEAAVMASYRYTAYLTAPKPRTLAQIGIEADAALASALAEGEALGECVSAARDLVNEPSNAQTPERLAAEAAELGRACGLEIEILDVNRIRALGMDALYAVGKGSPNPPAVIVMRHHGDPAHPGEIIGLIGKGVTYDSGGLNLKSGQRFTTMKHDMAGGGTAIGAILAIARQRLCVNAVAVIPACENLVSGNAYKPGDVIGSMAGKTIQINSTDAEGRLALIDAMHYAVKCEHVTRMIDIGTLTGAARRILGEYGAPVLGNDDALWHTLEQGAADAGELVCRVPLVEDARQKMRGDVSDYVNTSLAETGGMVTAALFLEEFALGTPWMHIDAAGPLWLDRDMPYTPKGGSGWGVRTLYHCVKRLAEK